MSSTSDKYFERYRAVALFAVFLGILASRRWPQFVSPQVWDEEGFLIKGFIQHGWLEVFRPIHGYLLMVPKIMVGVSLAISVHGFPVIATALAWIFTGLVGVAIALSPTHLKGRPLCALAAFIVPSDPEVFGTALYTFWWAGLLLFLLTVWDERKPALRWRIPFLLAGGLSSPVIVALVPVFYFRAFRFREIRAEKWVAAVATVIAGLQFYFTRQEMAGQFPPLSSIATHVIPKFFGFFLIGNLHENLTAMWVMGLAILALISTCAVRDRHNITTWTVLFLLVAAVALTVARLDPQIPHARLAGPRYFFYPFVMTFWAVIQGIYLPHRIIIRALAGVAVGLAAANSIPVWGRQIQHDDLRWADHVRSSVHFPDYTIPIQLDGNRFLTWSIREPGAVWREFLGKRRLFSAKGQSTLPTFAYRLVDYIDGGPGVGPDRVPSEDRKLIPASVSPISGKQEINLHLNRGDRIYFKPVPGQIPVRMRVIGAEGVFIEDLPLASDWVTLEFSNAQLPATFTVKVEDENHGLGEWSFIIQKE